MFAFISCLSSFTVRYFGVLGIEEPHQSIPNLVVKLYCGDDSVGEVLRKNSLIPLILITFSIVKSNKNEKGKGRLIQNPNYEIPYLPLHTSERTVLIERE